MPLRKIRSFDVDAAAQPARYVLPGDDPIGPGGNRRGIGAAGFHFQRKAAGAVCVCSADFTVKSDDPLPQSEIKAQRHRSICTVALQIKIDPIEQQRSLVLPALVNNQLAVGHFQPRQGPASQGPEPV